MNKIQTGKMAIRGREDAGRWRRSMTADEIERWDAAVMSGGSIRGNKVYDQAFRTEWQRLRRESLGLGS